MKNKKVLLPFIAIVVVLQFMTGCSRSAAPLDSPESKEFEYKAGEIIYNYK